ncbi:hypothetical protein H4217_008747, partial [Coemansia sp. RSA 1939]
MAGVPGLQARLPARQPTPPMLLPKTALALYRAVEAAGLWEAVAVTIITIVTTTTTTNTAALRIATVAMEMVPEVEAEAHVPRGVKAEDSLDALCL